MKIKLVDITGFRAYAYHGDGIFDFQNKNGDLANFVSIYAPNGFGKSSFYDAMEWAITNNISRYIRESLRTINESTSKGLNTSEYGQKILRNRYITDDLPAYVCVVTTEEVPFKRDVKKARRGSRDYTYDPTLTDVNTKHLRDIFLSQDSIDSFLKEERPEVRYEKFMLDFGGEDEKYRKKLASLIKTANKEVADLTKQVVKISEKFQDPELEFSIDQVNQIIKKLKDKGEHYEFIDSSFSELDSTELSAKVSHNIVKLENLINQSEESRIELQACLNIIPQLNQLKETIQNKKNRLAELMKNKDFLIELSKIISNKTDTEIFFKQLIESIISLENVIHELPDTLDLCQEIKSLESELFSTDSSIASLNVSVEGIKKLIKNLCSSKEEINIELSILQGQLDKIDHNFEIIDKLENILKFHRQKVNNLEERKTTLERLEESLKADLANYLNIKIGYEIPNSRVISLLKPESEFILNFTQYLNYKELLNKELADLNKKAKDIDLQSNEMYKLISSVNLILSQSISDTCPVCKTKHDSHEELLAKIYDNSGFNLALNLISKAQSEKELELKNINNFLVEGVEYLEKLKISYLSDIEEKQKILFSELSDLNTKISELNNKIKIDSMQLNEVRLITNNLPKNDLLSMLTISLKNKKLEIQKYDNELDIASGDLIKAQNQLNNFLIKKSSTESFLVKYKNNEKYINFLHERKLYIVSEGSELKDFENKLNEFRILRNDLEDKIKLSDSKVISFHESISLNNWYTSLPQLEEESHILFKEITNINDSILNIENKISKYVGLNINNYLDLSNDILKLVEKNELNLVSTQSELLDLMLLQNQIHRALPFIKYWEAQDNIANFNERIKILNLLNCELSKDLRLVEERLLNRIKEFFYTDLINRIYKKIDPHPFFKDVSFQCVFTEAEKPRLEVYLYEREGNSPISPSLYFSAAQLNILSLSIFLAKALHVEHNGKPVNTILIDDPIQSMDSINILATIDLLRNISMKFDKQIILSTHDENFHELLKLKIPENEFGSKFIKFSSFGKVVQD